MAGIGNKSAELLKNSAIVSTFTTLGVISGFAVDALIAASFGVGAETDAFFVAYALPNMATLFTYAVCTWTLIPLFSRRLAEDSEENVWRFFSIVLNLGTVLLSLVALAGMLGAPLIISLVAPGFDTATTLLATQLSRILLLMIFFTAMVEVGKALLYARRFFAIPSALKFLADMVVIIGILVARGTQGILAVAEGYILGEICQLVLLGIVLFRRLRFKYHFSFDANYPGVKEAGKLMLAPLSGSLVRESYIIAEKAIGSFLPAGSITALGYARRIVTTISSVFLGSITTALLPPLSVDLKQKIVKAKQALTTAFNFGSIVSISIGTGCMVLSVPLIRLFFERGRFDQEATLLTGSVLALYCIYVMFCGYYRVITTYFYAALKARIAVYLDVCLTLLTIVLDLILMRYLQARGLALAHSIGMGVTAAVGYLFLRKMVGAFDWKGLAAFNGKVIAASVVMGLVVYNLERWLRQMVGVSNTLSQFFVFGPTVMCGVISFTAMAMLLRIEELQLAFGWVRRRLSVTGGRLLPTLFINMHAGGNKQKSLGPGAKSLRRTSVGRREAEN